MNAFVAECRSVYQNILLNPGHYSKLRVVLGNESCDLDSAISALVYGFVLYHEAIERNESKCGVLPLLNISHDDLPLKTELIFFLKENKISMDWVPTRGFRDLLDLEKVKEGGNLELILVDHHVLCGRDEGLRESVVEVIDHRPEDPAWRWQDRLPSDRLTMRNVGSCCTLITDLIKGRSPHLITQQIAKLLLGPILVDCVNMSESAGRATPLDKQMIEYLERTVEVDRNKMYLELIQAKSDIASLTTSQLLRKDLKILGGVPVVGVPCLIAHLKNRPDFENSVTHFAKLLCDVPVVVLMGVLVEGELVTRDLAVFGRDKKLIGDILQPLLESKDPFVGLEEVAVEGILSIRLFKQSNTNVTRKHIGPILVKTVSTMQAIQRCGLK